MWLGCRAIARVTLINVQSLSTNDLLINAIMATCVVISTQVALGQFLKVSQMEADERHDLHVRRMERLEKQLSRTQANVEALTILKNNAGEYSECAACANAAPMGAGAAGAVGTPEPLAMRRGNAPRKRRSGRNGRREPQRASPVPNAGCGWCG